MDKIKDLLTKLNVEVYATPVSTDDTIVLLLSLIHI